MIDETTRVLGGTVIRELPPETWYGLNVSKTLTQHGGVIRFAPGTEHGGQIFRHLLIPRSDPASELASQLAPALSQQMTATTQLLAAMNQTMILAGLNVAVSAVSFAVLYAKLNQIDGRLKAIAVDVRAVRELLEGRERAELKSALDTVRKAGAVVDHDVRREMILAAYQILSIKRTMFEDQLAELDSPEVAAATEAYFTIAALGSARCSAEIGSLELAATELQQAAEHRLEHVRRISQRMLDNGRARFLHAEFVEALPTALLGETLDFVYDEARGTGWLDTLREELGPYYADEASAPAKGALAVLRGTASGASRRLSAAGLALVAGEPNGRARAHDVTIVVPTLLRFAAASPVIDGYVDQYRLMAAHDVTPSALEKQLAALPDEQRTDGYTILSFEDRSKAA